MIDALWPFGPQRKMVNFVKGTRLQKTDLQQKDQV